jgi:FMN reductase
MPRIVTICGNPFPASRTHLLTDWVGARLAASGLRVSAVNVRDLPAEDLLWCRCDAPALKSALSQVAEAVGVVVVTPVFKAAYSAAMKAFLDVLPQHALEGKVVLPLAVGGSLAHMLAIDYGLRPVLTSMGASHVVGGAFVLDKLLERTESGLRVDPEAEQRLDAVLRGFVLSVGRHHGPYPRLHNGNGEHAAAAANAS